ncbi:NUDIX hydrolase [Saccharopolyspora sp.]|uniref:NUDIX domain-containing protein n=1 Tax=Saccharopolyspora sp. TaxID=33915 RepID=UPI0025E73326|nr:NUDIX hydrolase [Saccharopolyspora sp.]
MSSTENAGANEIERTGGTHRFSTVATEDVYVGKILALRADEVAMPGGVQARREVVEHLGAVSVVVLDDADQVVLIHQYRYPVGRRLWELPAGLLDVAGEDPLHTAQRELAEEVGLAAESWSVLADIASSPGFTDQSERIFLARGLSDVQRPDATGDEEADLVIRRFPFDEAVRMVFAGEIVNAPAVTGLLAAHAVRAGAQPRPPEAEWQDRPHSLAKRLHG